MARLNRIGNIERLVDSIRNLDSGTLMELSAYKRLTNVLAEVKNDRAFRLAVLYSVADLIEEAMEKEGFNRL